MSSPPSSSSPSSQTSGATPGAATSSAAGTARGEAHVRLSRTGFLRRVFLGALVIELLIGACDLFLNYYQWLDSRPLRRAFNITREDALGNWFSSTQTLVCAVVLLWVYWWSRRSEKLAWGWAVLSAFFFYMAVDDATKMHERIGSTWGGGMETLSYHWQYVLGPFFAAMGLFLAWFIWTKIPERKVRLWMVAGLGCLAFAVAMDFFEGMEVPGWTHYEARHTLKLIEEVIEMIGISFLLITFLYRAQRVRSGYRLEWTD